MKGKGGVWSESYLPHFFMTIIVIPYELHFVNIEASLSFSVLLMILK